MEAILAITVEDLKVSYHHSSSRHLYVHRHRSFLLSVGPAVAAAVGTSLRRARRTGDGEGGRRSVLEAQRRRVGLDEDGPEDLHVLAGARLDVLVQDVDAPPCEPITIHKSETTIACKGMN